jgi:flagellar basal body-associated protein FliL
MSEEAKPEGKKKGGSKLPVVLVLGLMLGAGGFFGMKMRGGDAKPKKPEVKLGKEKPAELKEFLVNLADRGVFCRTEIALGTAEGADPKLIEDHEGPVRDAINLCLKSKTLAQVSTVEGLKKLKREIAADVNEALAPFDANAEKGDKGDKADKSDSKKTEAKKEADSKPEHPDWDSDTGPVLKVYFSSFATQS